MAQQTFEEIVAAVKQAESRGKRYAADGKTLTTSPKGALGEMQVMPKTITDPGFGVTPAKDKSPDEIARVGRDYLQAMLGKYGDTEKALVAYNWGPGATDKWLASGAKPEALPAETRTYVQRVKGLLGKDVPRETMAKKEREPLPESLPPMAQAEPKATTVAMASGKNLPDIKSLPPSYQAAFALAALADAQDEEDDRVYNENKQTESEKLLADYKPVNYLASLDLSVEPVMMADGGEVDAEEKRPDNINYFSNVNRMKDRGVTTDSVMLGARTKAGEGSVIAGLNMANMSKDEKLQTARALMAAYTQQDPEGLGVNANVVKPLNPKGPSMANLMGSIPVGEGRVSAGLHGGKAFSLGYNQPLEGGQFNANLNIPRGNPSAAQLNLQYNKRFAEGGEVEGEDLTKPSFGNPNIRKQGEAARRLAAMRDVNTLPDPKTYAAVAGALGTRPDQMGFSVLHPKANEIRDVANPAFAAGTALQMAPAVQALGGGKAAKMLSNMAGQELNAALMGERPGTLLDMFTAPAQPKFMFVRARPEAAARHADLQAQGLSPEQIRAQNLTLVDNRGNLIEEISDAPAVLQQKTASVPRNFYEMLKHPELESIYPTYDMPQVMMETTKRKGAPLAMGNFDVQNNMISGRIRDLPEDDARSMVRGTVLHEGQHAIQSAEGFTEGANPGAFIAYVKARQGKYNPDPTVNENVIREMERTYPNLASVADNFTTRLQADKYMKYVVSDPDRYVGETLYRHMPGEVQAELARVRSNLSPEQLKATPLEVSMQQLGVDPKNILEMNKMGSRPDRYVGDIEYDGYAHGGIVHRADGSPEEGERLTPQQIEQRAAQDVAEREAASNAAFIAQKSGIGRKAGPVSQALQSGQGQIEFLKGMTNVPQNILGAPMDISNMVASIYGGNVEKPFMGSEYLKEKSRAAGLGFKPSTDPTLAGFYGAGDLGSNLVNPAGVTRTGVKAAEKTGEAAKMLARDFQQYNQNLAVPGASYAVRNKGTPVAMTGLPFLPNVDEAERVVKAVTIGQRAEPLEVTDKSLNDWFSKTVTRYLRSDFATPQDQLVRAAEEGKALHLAPKEFSDSAEDQALKHFLGRRQFDLEHMRQVEGFGKTNMATQPYGQRIEDITDISVYPEMVGDLTPNRVPASMRNLVETQPEARVTDFAPNIVENLKLEALRDKMLDVRQSDGKYGAYGQPAAKIPSEFMLPDDTLAKLNVAAASNRMARYTNWQNDTRQKMATTALRADPEFPRAQLQDGKFIGVALPDVKKNPEMKQLVTDVGCDGGWCTRYTPNAEAYASGFNRLHVIVTGEGKQARPVAQFSVADNGPSYDTNRFSITEIKEKGNTADFANNPALPAIQQYIQHLDKTYGGLDYVDNLKGLRMTQLPEYPMRLLELFNPTVQQRRMLENKYGSEENGFRAVRDKAVDLNNGSRFMTGNEDAVANSLEQAMQLLVGPKETLARRIQMNLFGLPKEKATGGMIERQPTDNRRYL
jgi:hypothetical protein